MSAPEHTPLASSPAARFPQSHTWTLRRSVTAQVTVHVEKPVEHCYYIWLDRLNYLNWFDLISEVLHGDQLLPMVLIRYVATI